MLNAMDIGKAAEHLVCADLLLSGYQAFLSDQGLPYDLLVDVGGRLIRVQVKATQSARNANMKGRAANMVYVFNVRTRGSRYNPKRENLSEKHCDLVALVATDIRTVAYMHLSEVYQTVSLHPPGYTFPGNFKRSRQAPIDQYPFHEALAKC